MEALEDRTLPSASSLPAVFEASPPAASSVAAISSYVSSMMEQRAQLIATIEQVVIGDYQVLSQEIVQAVYSVQQQVGRFFGIYPNTPNQAFNTAVTQPDSGSGSGMGRGNSSGSGSGSSALTTNNAPNQALNIGTQQSGSGSGSGSGTMTTAHGNASTQGGAKLQPLTSGTGSAVPEVYFDSGIYNVPENFGDCGSGATLQIDLGFSSTQSVSVTYTTSDGTATANIDYTPESQTVTFAPGQTTMNITIPILDDGTDESASSDYFNVTLSAPNGGTLGSPSVAQVYIMEGPQQQPTDTLVWNPRCGNYDASVSSNWYDQTIQTQLTNGQPGPGPYTPIIFDAYNFNNSPITWDQSYTVASISLNQYTNVQTVDADLTTSGYVDEDIGVSYFVVAFAAGADLNFKAGQDVMGNFNWQAGGKVTVNGANLNIGSQANLNQSTASPLIINSGSVAIGPASSTSGASTFKLTNGSADINVNANGILQIFQPVAETTLVDNTGTSAWISNNGTTELFSGSGNATGVIAAPFENHSVLDASGGYWEFSRADANGNDLFMDAGQLNLANGVALAMPDNYTQTGGTLKLADNTSCRLSTLGTANFDGGNIVFASPTYFGTFSSGPVAFSGVEIDMRIDYGGTASDQIICVLGNKCVIQGNSKLVVTAAQAVNPGIKWTLIKPNTGSTITGDFLPANITLPNNVKETAGALPNSWQCNS